MSKIDQSGKMVVSQCNTLIESCYRMTLNEKRLLLLAISKLNPYVVLPDNPESMSIEECRKYLKFIVTIEEWNKYYPRSSAHRDMNKASEGLFEKTFTYHEKEGGSVEERTTRWFSEKINTPDNMSVGLVFNPLILNKLISFIGNYTQYDFLEVSRLNSQHSIRLYELLKQFKKTGYKTTTLEDFRAMMCCEEKYKILGRLKDHVIKPAIKEITEKTDIKNIRVENIKTGRKVTGLKFYFTPEISPIDSSISN